jgi:hypothetical protein
VRLPKVGLVKFRDTRPMHGTLKNATVRERAKFCVLGWEPVMEEDGELSERLFPFSLWHDG